MNLRTRLMALAAATALATSLGACGGSGTSAGITAPPEDTAVIEVPMEKLFEGYDPHPYYELDTVVEEAKSVGAERADKVADDAEEATLNAKVNKRFTKGNEYYAAGDYAKAQERYEKVLSLYPLHYGANVNLTLALLEQEKAQEALLQSLVCCYLFKSESAPMLNVQVAGAACGYASGDIEEAIGQVITAAGGNYDRLKSLMTTDNQRSFEYNAIWSDIETDLFAAAQEKAAAGDADDDAAAEDVAATDAQTVVDEGRDSYDTLERRLELLEEDLPGDADIPALHAYVHAVGLQLGYRVDPTLIEPVHTMPFIAVDDELCTIEAMEVSETDAAWHITMDVTNNVDDINITVRSLGPWTANGSATEGRINGVTVSPGETQQITLVLDKVDDASEVADEDGAAEDEDGAESGASEDDGSDGPALTSFMGAVYVSGGSNDHLALYPLSWEAS